MLALVIGLVVLWIALGIIGFTIKGLFWLAVIAGVLFLVTLVFGGSRMRGTRPNR